MKKETVKLCFGTAQFGMKYGVNNQIGRQPTYDEVFEMLDLAIENGIRALDTSSAYGNAEEILGMYFSSKPDQRRKVTLFSKLRFTNQPGGFDKNCGDILSRVKAELEGSLKRLNTDHLEGYLLHVPDDVYNAKIVDALSKLKEERLVDHIGVSIYNLKEGLVAIDTGVLDAVQLPYSIMDQRGAEDGFFHSAKNHGFVVATRSAFLQGFFQMKGCNVPEHLRPALPYVHIIEEVLDKYHLDLTTAALGFVKAEADIDYLVFGAEKKEILQEDIHKFNEADLPLACIAELKSRINDVPESIIFPSNWGEKSSSVGGKKVSS